MPPGIRMRNSANLSDAISVLFHIELLLHEQQNWLDLSFWCHRLSFQHGIHILRQPARVSRWAQSRLAWPKQGSPETQAVVLLKRQIKKKLLFTLLLPTGLGVGVGGGGCVGRALPSNLSFFCGAVLLSSIVFSTLYCSTAAMFLSETCC